MKKEIGRLMALGFFFGGAYLIGIWALGIAMFLVGIGLMMNWVKKYAPKKKGGKSGQTDSKK